MIPRGEETLRKIERHRKMRETRGISDAGMVYGYCRKNREKSLPENACVLLECLSNLTANEIYEPRRGRRKCGRCGDRGGPDA